MALTLAWPNFSVKFPLFVKTFWPYETLGFQILCLLNSLRFPTCCVFLLSIFINTSGTCAFLISFLCPFKLQNCSTIVVLVSIFPFQKCSDITQKKSFCKHSSGNGSWRNNFGLKAAFFINKNVRGHCNESIVFLVNRIYVYASQYWMEPITKISSVTHDPLSYMCWSRIILCSALIWLFHFFDFLRAVEVLALPFCK